MKMLKVYIKVVEDASERCWSLTSAEHSTDEQTANDSEEFSDNFDDFSTSFMQSSDGDQYGRLICGIFLKDCLVELLLMHLTECCHPSAVGSAEPTTTLPKLAKIIAQMLSKFAEHLVNRLPVDCSHRIKISEQYCERLKIWLADVEYDEFVCSADLVYVLNSFVPLMSPSMLTQLIILLLQSPEDCVELLEDGTRTLSQRGRLTVRVLQQILDQLDSVQPEILTSISARVCKIIKLVPSDDTICSCLAAVAKQIPQFASNVKEGAVSSLLKASTQPSLNLMTMLAMENAHCKQLMIEWFAAHKKTWSHDQSLPLYVNAVLFMLKTCHKGLLVTYFVFVAYLVKAVNSNWVTRVHFPLRCIWIIGVVRRVFGQNCGLQRFHWKHLRPCCLTQINMGNGHGFVFVCV